MNDELKVTNLYTQQGVIDPAVGISLIQIAGDSQLGLYSARIAPSKKVTAHYHKEGLETYQIVEGSGVMHTGTIGKDGNVEWRESKEVKKGDAFSVFAGEVHQLENTGDTELIAVFACPASHLSTDRTVVQGK